MAYFELELKYREQSCKILAVLPAFNDQVLYYVNDLKRFLDREDFSHIRLYRDILRENRLPSAYRMVQHDTLLPDLRRINSAKSRFLYSQLKFGHVRNVHSFGVTGIVFCIAWDSQPYRIWLQNFNRNQIR